MPACCGAIWGIRNPVADFGSVQAKALPRVPARSAMQLSARTTITLFGNQQRLHAAVAVEPSTGAGRRVQAGELDLLRAERLPHAGTVRRPAAGAWAP